METVPVQKILLFLFMAITYNEISAQKIESIYFNLYTDSLKKGGIHNYINIDGKTADGKWQPLSSKEIQFSASCGIFEGNDLILPDSPTQEKITIRATLRSNPEIWKETTIWIKKKKDNEPLKTAEEILDEMKKDSKKNKKKNKDSD